MKTRLKKVISFILILSMCVSRQMTSKTYAEGYNIAVAKAYAAVHWNNGEGNDAEFVTACIRAGGMPIKESKTAADCFKNAQRMCDTDVADLRLDAQGYARFEYCGTVLDAGDVVLVFCQTHNEPVQILYCSGYDGKGNATFYGHNPAINNEAVKLNAISAGIHADECSMMAKAVHLSSVVNVYGSSIAVCADYADEITDKTGVMHGTCTKIPGTKVTEYGLYIGESVGSMVKSAFKKVTDAQNSLDYGSSFPLEFDAAKDTDLFIKPATIYFYSFYCIANGSEYKSETNTFMTAGTSKRVAIEKKYELPVKVTVEPNHSVVCYSNYDSTSATQFFAEKTYTFELYCDQYVDLSNGKRRFHMIDGNGNDNWFDKMSYMSFEYYGNCVEVSQKNVIMQVGKEIVISANPGGAPDANEPIENIMLPNYTGSWYRIGNDFYIKMERIGEYDITFRAVDSRCTEDVHISVREYWNPTPTPTPTLSVTPTPTAEPTEVPKATPTATPTPTAEPTPTPTAVPTPKPTSIPELADIDDDNPTVGDIRLIGKGIYQITSTKSKTLAYICPADNTATSATVPATAKIDDETYKVTRINAGAFKGNTAIKKVTIGSNCTKIGKNAFYDCKNLKTIVINSKSISAIGANALKNVYSKAAITCPADKVNLYKKLFFDTTGFKTTMTIKAK